MKQYFPVFIGFIKSLFVSLFVIMFLGLFTACHKINESIVRKNVIDISSDGISIELQQLLDNKVMELNVFGIQASVRVGDFYWDSTSGSIDKKWKTN